MVELRDLLARGSADGFGRAAVEDAENWGTYVVVHAYTPRAIQGGIAAGVKVIEHGHLMDEATARLMAEKGIWLSVQPFLDDEDATACPTRRIAHGRWKVVQGTGNVDALAKKYKLKTAFGTDVLFSAELARRQGAQGVKLMRWYTPSKALTMATGANGELLRLSGPRNSCPGKLGVVEEGARRLAAGRWQSCRKRRAYRRSGNKLVVIMKNGTLYKNPLVK